LNRIPSWLPVVLLLALLFGIAGIAANKFMKPVLPEDLDKYGLGHYGDFLQFHEGAKALLAGEDIYLAYQKLYSYPPMLAILIAPLGYLHVSYAGVIWSFITAIIFFALSMLSAKEILRRFDVPTTLRNVGAVAFMGSLIMADKIRSEMRMGQCDGIVMLSLFWALTFIGRKPLIFGLLLGVATNVKYQGLIMLPYLLVRKRWVEAVSSVAWAVVIALSSALVF